MESNAPILPQNLYYPEQYSFYSPPPQWYQPPPTNYQIEQMLQPQINANNNQCAISPTSKDFLEEKLSSEDRTHRLTYTKYQLELLNCIYEKFKYPNQQQKQLLAKRIGITRSQVKIWFQNRRRKEVTERHPKGNMRRVERRCVPQSVVDGVLDELKKYEQDVKHKNVLQFIKDASSSNIEKNNQEIKPTSVILKGQDKPSSDPICYRNPPNAVAPTSDPFPSTSRQTQCPTVYIPTHNLIHDYGMTMNPNSFYSSNNNYNNFSIN